MADFFDIAPDDAIAIFDDIAKKTVDVLDIFEIASGEVKPYSQILQEANDELGKLNLSYEQLVLELKESKEKSERFANELRKANRKLEELAFKDGLTNLFNHRYFQEQLNKAFQRAARYNRQLTLAIIDIDHFKQINDRYGHPVGDEILQEIAKHLYQGSRQTDIVARYGGEEFAIIMDETHWKDAFLAVERLRESVAQREFSVEGEILHCTLSIGLANYPEHALDKNEIIKFADQALYQAKGNGRNRVEIFSNQVEQKSLEEHNRTGRTGGTGKSTPSINAEE